MPLEQAIQAIMEILGKLDPKDAAALIQKLGEQFSEPEGAQEQGPQPMAGGNEPMAGKGVPVQ